MSLERELRRGEHARRLLEDPLLVEAFDAVETGLRSAWAATGEAEERERERLWLMLRLLARVRGYITSVMETGKLADRQLATIEQRPESARGSPIR